MGVTCTICWCRIYCFVRFLYCNVNFSKSKKCFCFASPLHCSFKRSKDWYIKVISSETISYSLFFSPPKSKTRRNVWRYQRSNNERTNNCDITTSTLLRLNGVPNMRRQSTLHINSWMGTCLVTDMNCSYRLVITKWLMVQKCPNVNYYRYF